MKYPITGVGLISPAGFNLDSHVEQLRSGISPLAFLQTPMASLSEEAEKAVSMLLTNRKIRLLDRVCHLAIVAARQAVNEIDREQEIAAWGVVMGSARGASRSLELTCQEYMYRKELSPYSSPTTTLGVLGATVGRDLGCTGMALTLSTTCTTSLSAVGVACMMLGSHTVPGVVVGSSEASNSDFMLEMLKAGRVLYNGEADSLPHRSFCTDRQGMVLGEGAYSLAIEQDRGQSAYGYIVGFGSALESGTLSGVSRKGKALSLAVSRALKDANVDIEDVDFIVGHGSATKQGDASELEALRTVFGAPHPPIVSHKWMTGHLLSASAGVSIGLALDHLGRQDLVMPPLQSDLLDNRALPKTLEICLVVALGFGGYASAVVISRS